MAAETAKRQNNTGHGRPLCCFRVRLGLALIQAKAARTPAPRAAEPIGRLEAIKSRDVRRFVVHLAPRAAEAPASHPLENAHCKL